MKKYEILTDTVHTHEIKASGYHTYCGGELELYKRVWFRKVSIYTRCRGSWIYIREVK